MKPSCDNCKFFDQNVNDIREGWCRRYPPTIRLTESVGTYSSKTTRHCHQSQHPLVATFDWCGEHQPKEVSND